MKKITITLAAFFISIMIFAQNAVNVATLSGAKIKLATGQKITIENDISIEASLGMGMEMISTSVSTNLLDVKNSTDKNYTISNSLTKLKANMSMAGQSNSYDSENKESNDAEMAKIFDDRMNKSTDVVIDNITGLAITENKKDKKNNDDENPNMAEDLMKMFSDNTDDAVVSGAFEVLPKGKNIGNSWSDTSGTKGNKTIRTYTLNSITGNEAVIGIVIVATAKNKMEVQGMEFEITTETKTTGEIITDITTGLVKKRNTVSDITGSFQLMGQDMPINAKTTSTIIYK